MSRKDIDEVLLTLGEGRDLVRRIQREHALGTPDSTGRNLEIAIHDTAHELDRRLEDFHESSEDLAIISTEALQCQQAQVEALQDTSNLLDDVSEELSDISGNTARANIILKGIAADTGELTEVRTNLEALNRTGEASLGINALQLLVQAAGLKKMGDVEDAIEGLGDQVVGALEEATEEIVEQTRVAGNLIAGRIDRQTEEISHRLGYLTQVSNMNSRMLVQAVENLNRAAEERSRATRKAIRSPYANRAEEKFRDVVMNMSLGRQNAALRDLQDVFRNKSTHAPAWMCFGDCCLNLGLVGDAQVAYRLASRYAHQAQQSGQDGLAIKNQKVFEQSLIKLALLMSTCGRPRQAMQIMHQGLEAWDGDLSRLRYELGKLCVRDPSVSKNADWLVKVVHQVPELRVEISTDPIFAKARQARSSLRYGHGPFVELAETLELFELWAPILWWLANPFPDYLEPINLFWYLLNETGEDLWKMSGDCQRPSLKFRPAHFRRLQGLQTGFLKLRKILEKAELPNEYEGMEMLTYLQRMVDDGFAAYYLRGVIRIYRAKALFVS